MDESWRVRMGTPIMAASLPRRRRSSSNRSAMADPEALDPEDFADVFGGPPRSVFWRKISGEFAAGEGNSFYEEIFRPAENQSSGDFAGQVFPAYRSPGTSDRFYSDVFGSDSAGDDRRSRDRWKVKSKSTSSSVLSSEEMSPLRPAISGDHVAFSNFASKLRPINVPSRRKSPSTTTHANTTNINNTLWTSLSRKPSMQSFYTNRPSYTEPQYVETESHWNFGRSNNNFGFSRRVSSPETISLEPDSYPSVKISVEDVELNSPSSAVSSVCLDSVVDNVMAAKSEISRDHDLIIDDEDEDEDEIMSSYVIEIGSGSDHREGTCDAVGIDEAIAWAKERFQTHTANSEKDDDNNNHNNIKKDQPSKLDEGGIKVGILTEQNMENEHGIVQLSPNMEMRLQDENIRLWSVGKETDIRLLLSTLHFILWNNSGWSAIPLTNLIESSKVKKAYQQARLCLHPDKLQQRGATLPQKYIAEKAFSILQDAWSTFISRDVSFN